MSDIVTFAGRRWVMPYRDIPRAMTGVEREILERSIMRFGIRMPLLGDDEKDDPAVLLDGSARLLIAVEKKLPPSEVPIEFIGPLSPLQRAELLEGLLLGRKHLPDDEAKRDAFRLFKTIGLSNRAAAAAAGLSGNTKGQRDSPAARGSAVGEKRIGADGRNRPARIPTQQEIDARRAEVRERVGKGQTTDEIAAAMGCATGTIDNDRAYLKGQKTLRDVGADEPTKTEPTWKMIALRLLAVCEMWEAHDRGARMRPLAESRAAIEEAERFAKSAARQAEPA